MTRTHALVVALTVALLGLSAGPATAETIYGTTWAAGPNQLLAIDTTTGAGTLVGNLGPPPFVFSSGTAFRGPKLYFYDQTAGMREINPANGTIVNTINIGLAFVAWNVGGVAFRSDGIGFLANGNASVPNPQLYSFDITVPNNTLITAAFSPLAEIGSMAFNSADVLYGIGLDRNLYTINQATGAVTLVGSTGIPAGGNETGLTFDASGNLFLAYGAIAASTLYQVNPATGAATLIGPIGFGGVQGLAAHPAAGGGGGGGSSPHPVAGSGGVGEGSFAGIDPVLPPFGSEGSFGASSHVAAPVVASTNPPVLAGPFFASPGAGHLPAPSGFATSPPPGTCLQVYNTAGTGTAQAGDQQTSSGAGGVLGWVVFAALGVVVTIGVGITVLSLWAAPSNAEAA